MVRNLLMISASRSVIFARAGGRYPADITSYYWLLQGRLRCIYWIHFLPLALIFYWRGYGDYFSVYLLQNYTANEWQLIKNNNTAAALAFSGTCWGT